MSSQTAPQIIVWLTGLSGAGKSTLAATVRDAVAPHHPVEVLDGDAIRAHLSSDLGYSREDRNANIRRIGFVARLLARHGVVTIAAAISPYAATRDEVRALAEADGITYVEVYVSAPLASLVARDVKGLYRRALSGELPNFTGVSDPYEPPAAPDVTVCTDRESIYDSTAKILDALSTRGLAIAVQEPTQPSREGPGR